MKGAGEQHAGIDTFCYNALMNAAMLALSVFCRAGDRRASGCQTKQLRFFPNLLSGHWLLTSSRAWPRHGI